MWCWFLFVACIGVKPAESVLRFSKKPNATVSLRIGGNATFDWDYEVDDRETELDVIIWSVKNKITSQFIPMLEELKNGTRKVRSTIPSVYRGRVRIEGRATLVIENITVDDDNEFRCKLRGVLGVAPEVESIVKLIVTVPPRISTGPQISVTDQGGSVRHICNVTGNPVHSIKWFHDEAEIVHNNRKFEITSSSPTSSVLVIKDCAVEDYGYYTCIASGDGLDEAQYFLGVPFLNPMEVSTSVRPAKASMGQLVILNCPVTGFPTPEVSWTLPNGSALGNRLVSTLPIIPNTDADFGNYTCSARSLDKTTLHFNISIQRAVTTLESDVISGAPAEVKWSAVPNASYYLVKINGENVRDDIKFASGDKVSTKIDFHTLVLKAKNGDKVQITVQVLALNDDDGLLARGPRRQATVSASVALQATILHLCLLVQVLSG